MSFDEAVPLLMSDIIIKMYIYSMVIGDTTSKKEVRNYRPIAIINLICKLFMMLVRDKWMGGRE